MPRPEREPTEHPTDWEQYRFWCCPGAHEVIGIVTCATAEDARHIIGFALNTANSRTEHE